MAAIDIYIDCDQNRVVTSPTDSSPKRLPKFVQGDTFKFRIWLLKGFNRTSEYEQIPTEGITLEVGLGPHPVVGSQDPRTYYTQQFTWTPSEDLAQPYFEAFLSFATAGINTLLGTNAEKFATLHIIRTEEGYPNTVLQERVTIYAGALQENGLTEPAEPTPLSVEAANALYVKKSGFQGKLRLISEDGSAQADLYIDSDGTFHVDPAV